VERAVPFGDCAGYDAECREFFRTTYGYSYWPGCEFELYVGVNATRHLVGITRARPGVSAPNVRVKDFDLVKL
jgi:hypothetical protein